LIHLDPDLDRAPASRLPEWRPALGQTGNAQSHLGDMGVGVADVFVFFGWFRQTEFKAGTLRTFMVVSVALGHSVVAHKVGGKNASAEANLSRNLAVAALMSVGDKRKRQS
jgi:hypothetical protein